MKKTIYFEKILFCFVFSITVLLSIAQSKTRPKIGLTLSGGGAKGLAHIGILKALDSAGLKIDYVTGTSMGSIIGSLYAIGNSGNQIEEIARNTNWNLLLTNQVTLRAFSLEEKNEYDKYALELPFNQGKFSLPSGAIESEELWIKLSELYFNVSDIKKFNHFKIPFACIATDITNASIVVQDSGEIVTAIRASMAIPGVFTTVENKGMLLVDGGVIRNFPVSDAIAMGANYTIGSNVTQGLLPKEKLNNPLQILLQIAFLKEEQDYRKQLAITDLYIHQDLSKYGIAGFEKANEIIDSGIAKGFSLYPRFKKLADSLNAIYGSLIDTIKAPKSIDSILIKGHAIKGLVNISEASFLNSADFKENKKYAIKDLSEMVRRAYATREYQFIHYSLEPLPDGDFGIIFEVEEAVATTAKMGIHYNSFSGISLIANITSRNFFTPTSKSLLTVNIGDNLRVKAEHDQFFGGQKNLVVIPSVQYESFKINSYTNFKQDGLYRLSYFNSDIKFQWANQRNINAGLGFKYESEIYTPELQSVLELKGKDHYSTAYAYVNFNSLDRGVYPQKGIRFYGEFGYLVGQDPHLIYSSYGRPITSLDTTNINGDNYSRLLMNLETYHSINERFTFFSQWQAGINFSSGENEFNSFFIGGLNKVIRNQISFAGFQDATMHAQNVVAGMVGLRSKIWNGVYLIARTNLLVNDFLKNRTVNANPKWVTGSSITMAYHSLIGPIELSAMYSAQTQNIQTYVNIGIPF